MGARAWIDGACEIAAESGDLGQVGARECFASVFDEAVKQFDFCPGQSDARRRFRCLDLPIVLGDALVFEFDSGFAQAALMAVFGRCSQRSSGIRGRARGPTSNRSR
jgi:hypothetical protein